MELPQLPKPKKKRKYLRYVIFSVLFLVLLVYVIKINMVSGILKETLLERNAQIDNLETTVQGLSSGRIDRDGVANPRIKVRNESGAELISLDHEGRITAENVNLTNNLTVVDAGFFGNIGSLLRKVTTGWFTNIDSSNINSSRINSTFFYGNGSGITEIDCTNIVNGSDGDFCADATGGGGGLFELVSDFITNGTTSGLHTTEGVFDENLTVNGTYINIYDQYGMYFNGSHMIIGNLSGFV